MPYYFAYGSNLDPKRLEDDRLNPEGVQCLSRTSAKLNHFRLVFNKPSAYFLGAGAANIEAEKGSEIYGILYEMPEAGLSILDRYENVDKGHYQRLSVTALQIETGVMIEATTYIAENFVDNNLKPRVGYMNHLLAGADLLPKPYVDYLKSIPLCPEEPLKTA